MLGVSHPTIYARIKSGDLLAVQVSPNTIRIPMRPSQFVTSLVLQ